MTENETQWWINGKPMNFDPEKSTANFELTPEELAYLNGLQKWYEDSANSVIILGRPLDSEVKNFDHCTSPEIPDNHMTNFESRIKNLVHPWNQSESTVIMNAQEKQAQAIHFMTKDEIRIAVALECGWEVLPAMEKTVHMVGRINGSDWTPVPNYPHSLDACAEFWNTFNRKERVTYSRILREVVVNDGGHATSFNEDIVACCENATALQRCEAFLRVRGKWKG